MAKWFLGSIEINGGFLSSFSLTFPRGLTCIIGPRGSGKSTLVEAIRYGVGGLNGASKTRVDLIQGNLGKAILSLSAIADDSTPRYTIRRAFKQQPTLTTADGRVLEAELDRGTLLPLDGYSSSEIESIADEMGERRRALLDELVEDQLREVHIAIADDRRALSANADRIRAVREHAKDLGEQIEELGDAPARLAALPDSTGTGIAVALAEAERQQRSNAEEIRTLKKCISGIDEYVAGLTALAKTFRGNLPGRLAVSPSVNMPTMENVEVLLAAATSDVNTRMQGLLGGLEGFRRAVAQVQADLETAHLSQQAAYVRLQERNAAESQAVKERSAIEQQVTQLESLKIKKEQAAQDFALLLAERGELKANYLLRHERVSELRDQVASGLRRQIGEKVRIRVLRGADNLAYIEMLTEGLRGAGVRNHEGIIESLMRLRPEELAQMIQNMDLSDFEQQVSLGAERSRKILETFREKVDPLDLEVVAVEDKICIELNVGSISEPNFKDAASLSRGQKSTALLPLLIARRDVPLIIDQPEDNLDNHFIFETVVETIRKAKDQRQMIFVTHNANIPVLAEADLVVVLNSDGQKGFVEKQGTLNDCRSEIIDLLEGGREAFELRRKKYGDA